VSTRKANRLAGVALLSVLAVIWVSLSDGKSAPLRAATPTQPTEPTTDLADHAPAAAHEIAPNAIEASAPRAEVPQPSAAAPRPAEAANAPAISELRNTPRRRAAEPMRLHFANTPRTRTPGLGLSKAACDALRERQQHAQALSDRELLHLRLDCRGR
jgi:hypothetical protein